MVRVTVARAFKVRMDIDRIRKLFDDILFAGLIYY
jgi:hypothetical protein